MSVFPNLEALEPGDYVRNVHPYNAGRLPDGVVTGIVDDLGMVAVIIGRGSSVYGPAENWAPIVDPPAWLEAAAGV